MTRLTHLSQEHLLALTERATASAACWLLKAEQYDQMALLYDQRAMEGETKAKCRISPAELATSWRYSSEEARQYAARAKELVAVIRSRDPNALLPVYRPEGCELKMWFVAFDKELPMPAQVESLDDLRLKRVKDYEGMLEISVGDYLIGEVPKRRNAYQLKTFAFEGELDWVNHHAYDMKGQISAAIDSGDLKVDRSILKGVGPLGEIVRRIRADRAGFLAKDEAMSLSSVSEVFDRQAKRMADAEAEAEFQLRARMEADGSGDYLRSLEL